jgi:trehalose-6-phosphatase
MPSKRNLVNLGTTKKESSANSAKLEVKAIFLDYDGTISPICAERSDSAVLPDNLILLKQIAQLIPVAVITTKDLPFVMPRTPFAHAWAGIAGLEIRIGKTLIRNFHSKSNLPALGEVLKNAKHLSGHGLVIEEKLASDGATIAFSVDWRHAENNHDDAQQNAIQILGES